MNTLEIQGELKDKVVAALGQSSWFRSLKPQAIEQVIGMAQLLEYEKGEAIVAEGDDSDSFYLVLNGSTTVQLRRDDDVVEIGRMGAYSSFGEVGLLLDEPRTASILAAEDVLALRFTKNSFDVMFLKVPGFGKSAIRGLAGRLQQVSGLIPVSDTGVEDPDPDVLSLLPASFMQRHRVMPLRIEGEELVLGCVDDPSPVVLSGARQQVPGMELRPVRIDLAGFNRVMQSRAGLDEWRGTPTHAGQLPPAGPGSPRLDQLLGRMAAEGASDLHLSGGQKPHWRIDGDIRAIEDAAPLGAGEVLELLEPIMEERHRRLFADENDVDFAYSLPGVARFRVNAFADQGGVGAVFRQIPSRILTFQQLSLPKVLQTLCEFPKGLVLVTGPTGSGKSTTLAAMIDLINRTRKSHIITLEDPIEFVYESQACLVNQREIGGHTRSFARALKAALREDPDIVLVGEMRDLETISLALETANTGHLVFATLHTSSAVGTVDRIVDMFPGDQQAKIRATLSDALKGVVCQTLLKKRGGGRVGAYEILVANAAVANLIREGKTVQIPNVMVGGKAAGNQMLNDDLARLVEQHRVTYSEAYAHAVDKGDLARRCGKDGKDPA